MCQIELIPVSLQQSGVRFYIEADMLVRCHRVDKDASHMFTPILSDDSHRIELPMILVVGKNRYSVLRQIVWRFSRRYLKGYTIYKVLKAANRSFMSHPYRIHLDYEEWMSKAEISLLKNN